MKKSKSFDITVKHHLNVVKNSLGEEIESLTATFTKTFNVDTKEKAVEKVKKYCKKNDIKVIKILEPLERP